MNNKIGMAILLIWLTILSCQKRNSSIPLIKLAESEFSKIELSSLSNDIWYVPLSNDSLLASIIKVVYADDHFYILGTKSVWLKFGSSGKFETAIGRKGYGPGEYQRILDFTVDDKTNRAYALQGMKKFYTYNVNGKFIGDADLSINNPSKIEKYPNGLLVYNSNYSGDSQTSIELIDVDGNVIKRFPNKYKFESTNSYVAFANECLFYHFHGNLCFKEIHSDSVFCIEGNEIVSKYILDSGKNIFTTEIRKSISRDISKLRSAIVQTNLMETDRFLFFEYVFKQKTHLLTYDKQTSKQFEIDSEEGSVNDIDGGLNVTFQTVINNNTIMTWVNAYELKAHVASEAFKNSTPKYPEKKKELEQLVNSLDENDNPVLMLVKLKE